MPSDNTIMARVYYLAQGTDGSATVTAQHYFIQQYRQHTSINYNEIYKSEKQNRCNNITLKNQN